MSVVDLLRPAPLRLQAELRLHAETDAEMGISAVLPGCFEVHCRVPRLPNVDPWVLASAVLLPAVLRRFGEPVPAEVAEREAVALTLGALPSPLLTLTPK